MGKQQQLGQFWLAWRTDREEWAICWNDSAAGTRRRKSTGVGDFNNGEAPGEAIEKLAEHFARHGKPEEIDPNAKASVSRLISTWLAKEGINRARAAQYGYAADHLQRWINSQGRLMVSQINPVSTESYIKMRRLEGVTGETIQSELAALSRSLRWGELNGVIPYAPRVARVPATMKSGHKELEYSMEEVAALLEAARSRFDRQHVLLFTLIMLSTHARVEAVLELEADQIKKGRIHFNAPGRAQTSKRRAIVPVAPSLEPWLPREGKVIVYRALRKKPDEHGNEFYERPTSSIKTAFAKTLIDAGLIGDDGKPLGSPNTLRHTIHTYLQTVGVPQAQIDMAAGHSGERGSGRNYTHLRPEYLKDFIAAVEAYWLEMDKLTNAHRSQVGPNVYDLKSGRLVI